MLEIDGERFDLDTTDAFRIAEELRGQELGGRIAAVAMGRTGETMTVDPDPGERQLLFDAVAAVASGGDGELSVAAREDPRRPAGWRREGPRSLKRGNSASENLVEASLRLAGLPEHPVEQAPRPNLGVTVRDRNTPSHPGRWRPPAPRARDRDSVRA